MNQPCSASVSAAVRIAKELKYSVTGGADRGMVFSPQQQQHQAETGRRPPNRARSGEKNTYIIWYGQGMGSAKTEGAEQGCNSSSIGGTGYILPSV